MDIPLRRTENASGVISQLKLHRMWLEIYLFCQIALIVFANIVIEQGNRYYQGNYAVLVLRDLADHFLLFKGVQVVLEIAQQVQQHILVFAGRSVAGTGGHQKFTI